MLILKKQYELEGILNRKWSSLHIVNHCLCCPLICILAKKTFTGSCMYQIELILKCDILSHM